MFGWTLPANGGAALILKLPVDRENDGSGGFQVRFKFLTAIGALAGGWIRTNRKVSGGSNREEVVTITQKPTNPGEKTVRPPQTSIQFSFDSRSRQINLLHCTVQKTSSLLSEGVPNETTANQPRIHMAGCGGATSPRRSLLDIGR
jgi:hypothetical protein